MATDILSDIFVVRAIGCTSHAAPWSPWEPEMEIPWETTASHQRHRRAFSHLRAWHIHRGPVGLATCSSSRSWWRCLKVSWGRATPAESWLLCPPFLCWLQQRSERIWGLHMLSEHVARGEVVQASPGLDSSLCKPRSFSSGAPQVPDWGCHWKVGLKKILAGENNDHTVKIKTAAFQPSSWSQVINLFWSLVARSPPVGALSIFSWEYFSVITLLYCPIYFRDVLRDVQLPPTLSCERKKISRVSFPAASTAYSFFILIFFPQHIIKKVFNNNSGDKINDCSRIICK